MSNVLKLTLEFQTQSKPRRLQCVLIRAALQQLQLRDVSSCRLSLTAWMTAIHT